MLEKLAAGIFIFQIDCYELHVYGYTNNCWISSMCLLAEEDVNNQCLQYVIFVCLLCCSSFSRTQFLLSLHYTLCHVLGSPELIAVMLQIGNKVSRDLWEARRPRSRSLYPSSREERERFINAKYVDKEFLQELPKTDKTVAEVSDLWDGDGGECGEEEVVVSVVVRRWLGVVKR